MIGKGRILGPPPHTLAGWHALTAEHFRNVGTWPVFGVSAETLFAYVDLMVTEKRFVNAVETKWGKDVEGMFYRLIPRKGLRSGDIVVLGELANTRVL
jgi:hypothetical protein